MYLKHFKLVDFPFIQSARNELYFATEQIQTEIKLFHHWLDAGHGVFVVTGEDGVGRASLVHHALDTSSIASTERYVIGKLPLQPIEFLRGLALEMGIDCAVKDCMALRHAIRTHLRSIASLHHRVCIVVHNAHQLDETTRAFIEDLSQEPGLYLPLCHIVWVVDKTLSDRILKQKRSTQARQIHHVAVIKPLKSRETAQYMQFRMEQAGAAESSLFSADVIRQIHHDTRGKPQLINALCDRALCIAYGHASATVELTHLAEATAQLGWNRNTIKKAKQTKNIHVKESSEQTKPKVENGLGALERSVHELLSGVTTIGRAPDCSIRLCGSKYSPYQALIVRTQDGMFIRNEGSQVPLYLNGGVIESASLSAGDCVRLGSYQFSVNKGAEGKLSLVTTDASVQMPSSS